MIKDEQFWPESLDISPAYGRNYETLEAAKADWVAGKDFQIMLNGPYLSIRDSESMKSKGMSSVMIWTGPRRGIEVAL